MSRPRPILLAQSLLAAVQLIVGTAGFAEHVPADAAWWIITGLAGVQVGLAFYLQARTTPLSSPQDARGVPLVPADAAGVVASQASGATVVTAAPDVPQLGSTNPAKPLIDD